MFYNISAKIFYWFFLRKNNKLYIVNPDGSREPTELGWNFYTVYNYLKFRAK